MNERDALLDQWLAQQEANYRYREENGIAHPTALLVDQLTGDHMAVWMMSHGHFNSFMRNGFGRFKGIPIEQEPL